MAPWHTGTLKFSTSPELVAKVVDVVGLYLVPLETAVEMCVFEKSPTQAINRTVPSLPMPPGNPVLATRDNIRHENSTLFAALEIATGQVTAA